MNATLTATRGRRWRRATNPGFLSLQPFGPASSPLRESCPVADRISSRGEIVEKPLPAPGGDRGPSTHQPASVPSRAWLVAGAGAAVNLCLGILYAWSVWKDVLVAKAPVEAGSAMGPPNEGWLHLSDAE